jgi:thiamine-monophosphate kinase
MMDVSDGLDCDLQRLIDASRCGAVIEMATLPISDALSHVSNAQGWDAVPLALTGGEDYCLLVSVAPDALDQIRRSFQEKFGHPLYPVGHITHQKGRILYHRQGTPVDMQVRRYNHFH